jgi:hypothetical protein
MNYITILIFAVFVIPIALKEYQRDKGMNNWVKIINVFVCFILFYSFTNTVRDGIFLLFSNTGEFKEMMQSEIGFLSPTLNAISWFIFVILSFILTANVVLLTLRKEKSRILFLRLIPVLWIFKSIDLYKYFLKNIKDVRSDQASIFLFTAIGIICLILFILYTSKPFKSFFQYKHPVPDSL